MSQGDIPISARSYQIAPQKLSDNADQPKKPVLTQYIIMGRLLLPFSWFPPSQHGKESLFCAYILHSLQRDSGGSDYHLCLARFDPPNRDEGQQPSLLNSCHREQ